GNSGNPHFPGGRGRSLKRNRRRVEKLKPISYGTTPFSEEVCSPSKSVDIFFAGDVVSSSTLRVAGLTELRTLEKDGYVVDIPSKRLARSEFLQRMSAAWLAWSPAGVARECRPAYEVPLGGSVPM